MTSESYCKNQWWVPDVPTKKDPPSEPTGSRRYQLGGNSGAESSTGLIAHPVREGTTLLFSSRRTFLQSLSRSALVLTLENVFALAASASRRALFGHASQTTSPVPSVPATSNLGVSFVNVARESGLNVKTIFGGEHKNKYLLETTGCGVAFYDYDNDGWLDIFLVNGSRLDGFPSGQAPTSHLFKNNRDGTFTDVTAKAGVARAGWGQGVCIGDYDNDGFEDLFVTL